MGIRQGRASAFFGEHAAIVEKFVVWRGRYAMSIMLKRAVDA
ncbi:hypothetical protein [Halomonas flagellata]|nr:hypothetical protein [Halomonas flagellata]